LFVLKACIYVISSVNVRVPHEQLGELANTTMEPETRAALPDFYLMKC
jgi:hypothetical protein